MAVRILNGLMATRVAVPGSSAFEELDLAKVPPLANDQLLTVSRCAHYLHCSVNTLRRLVQAG